MTDVEPVWRKACRKAEEVEFREVQGEYELIESREGLVLERHIMASPEEDYILRGIDGGLYVVTKETFAKTYEIAEESAPESSERGKEECVDPFYGDLEHCWPIWGTTCPIDITPEEEEKDKIEERIRDAYNEWRKWWAPKIKLDAEKAEKWDLLPTLQKLVPDLNEFYKKTKAELEEAQRKLKTIKRHEERLEALNEINELLKEDYSDIAFTSNNVVGEILRELLRSALGERRPPENE